MARLVTWSPSVTLAQMLISSERIFEKVTAWAPIIALTAA